MNRKIILAHVRHEPSFATTIYYTHLASLNNHLPLIQAMGRYIRNDIKLRCPLSLILAAVRMFATTLNYDPTMDYATRLQ